MKTILKNIAGAFGYKIERLDNPNPLAAKYDRLIKELYGCYRDVKFSALPDMDETTLRLLTRLDGTQLSESIYILNALARSRDLPGDVCEFGVAQGYTSALLAYTIHNTNKNLWLFDSFQGLPAPTEKDKLKDDIFNLKSMEAYQGTMSHPPQSVLSNLGHVKFPLERTRIIDGFIEDTITRGKLPAKVSFAYVDFDFYNPIKTGLDFLHTVLTPGGIIVVDDYDFFSEGAKIAVDEFYAEHSAEYVLELPIPSAGKFALLTRKSSEV
jgi:hypothetical protein